MRHLRLFAGNDRLRRFPFLRRARRSKSRRKVKPRRDPKSTSSATQSIPCRWSQSRTFQGGTSSRSSTTSASCRRSANARLTATCCSCSTSRLTYYANRSRFRSRSCACTRSSFSRTRCPTAAVSGARATCASSRLYICTSGRSCATSGSRVATSTPRWIRRCRWSRRYAA
ncbi:hypothetical protein BN1723_018576 [Verticillium longisporum]|uniref:Uncharacterized protein n=1 Tax=Verticillium longisporum TaxID=100787 RepID=A0A0G4MLK6_VERLO|nr:hypothetical protein BN1723_018576 [Verticillium longisporum]